LKSRVLEDRATMNGFCSRETTRNDFSFKDLQEIKIQDSLAKEATSMNIADTVTESALRDRVSSEC